MLPVKVIQAALLFMPASDSRLFLNGLYVEVVRADIRVMASDGDALFHHEILEYVGIKNMAFIVPQFIVKLALARAKKQKVETIALDVDAHFFGDIGFKPIEQKYPNFELAKLMSGIRDEIHTTYDVANLQRLQRACKLLGDGEPILPKLEYFERCAMLWLEGGSCAFVMVKDI